MRAVVATVACLAVLAQPPTPAQLANTAVCDSLGFTDLRPYMVRIPVSSPYGASSNSTPVFLPIYASVPLNTSGLEAAVIFIHGRAVRCGMSATKW